jgi:hypothetical protein
MIIEVTESDIKHGSPKAPSSHPVLIAIRRSTGYPYDILDGGVIARCYHPVARLPDDVFKKVLAYDRTGKMAPFKFNFLFDIERKEVSDNV